MGSTRQESRQQGTSNSESPGNYESADVTDSVGAAFRSAADAAATASRVAGIAGGIAWKAAESASPEITSIGKKAVGAAGTAAAVAGIAGKSVLDSVVGPRATRLAEMQLKELLAFLGQATGEQKTVTNPVTNQDVQILEQEA